MRDGGGRRSRKEKKNNKLKSAIFQKRRRFRTYKTARGFLKLKRTNPIKSSKDISARVNNDVIILGTSKTATMEKLEKPNKYLNVLAAAAHVFVKPYTRTRRHPFCTPTPCFLIINRR